jgi:hypothetical protein
MNRIIILAASLCLGFSAYAADDNNGNGNTPGAGANGKVVHDTKEAHAANGGSGPTFAIQYHGGPIIAGQTNVYYIWYGTWDSNSVGLLENLAQYIGASPYYHINTTYYSSANGVTTPVTPKVVFAGHAIDNYSQGKSLSDSAVQAVVSHAISSGQLVKDTNGVYFVLTASDVKETSGFCSQYCGWHTHATVLGADIKYAFVGNPATQCPSSCAQLTSSSPNGNIGADAMASIVAHELEESVTDPDLNAWYDKRGSENADKCAWTFGTTSPSTNGSPYNVQLNGIDYLIQQNWVNSGSGYCALQY